MPLAAVRPPEAGDPEPHQATPVPGDAPLSFASHLDELRRRLAVSLLAFLVATGLAACKTGLLIEWLRAPAGDRLPVFAFFSPTEAFVAHVTVAVLGGVLLSSPFILAQAWGFIRRGLTPQERTRGLAFVGWATGLFLAGCAFAYAVLLPVSLRLLLDIGRAYLEPVISIDRYVSFVTALIFWCGVSFELPAILVLLARLGIVTSEWLRQQRPYAILIIVVIAAVATPTTDAVTLLLLAGPLAALYELSVWLTRLRRPKPAPDRD